MKKGFLFFAVLLITAQISSMHRAVTLENNTSVDITAKPDKNSPNDKEIYNIKPSESATFNIYDGFNLLVGSLDTYIITPPISDTWTVTDQYRLKKNINPPQKRTIIEVTPTVGRSAQDHKYKFTIIK